MNVQIHMLNQYSPWEQVGSEGVKCFVKGNFFPNGKLLNSTKLLDLLLPAIVKKNENIYDLIDIFRHLNGEYAIVLETPDQIVCAVDRIRSIPIFYSKKDNHLIVSDDAYYIKEQIKPVLDEKNAAEFLVTGYVTGQDTLFEDIKQLQAGEILIYDKAKSSLTTSPYFRFLHNDSWELDEDALLNKLDDCFVNVFNRLIESTVKQGLQIVVPLSGGLDSRIIVAMLKRLGVEDVICFSYGNKDDFEVNVSKKIAEALEYKWVFIEYTRSEWEKSFNSNDIFEYQRYGGNLASMAHIQDFLAIESMKKKGILDKNIVFVPGHTGDMLAGSYIPLESSVKESGYVFDSCSDQILLKHYNLWNWNNVDLEEMFKLKIKNTISSIEISDYISYVDALEMFNFKERQSKYIVNSVRAYEFFGYAWRIPLWDLELINFFEKLPIDYKLKQYIYIKYASKILFSDGLEKLSKIECTTKLRSESKLIYIKRVYKFIRRKLKSPIFIPTSIFKNKDVEQKLYTYSMLKSIYENNPKGIFPYGNDSWSLYYVLSLIEWKNKAD